MSTPRNRSSRPEWNSNWIGEPPESAAKRPSLRSFSILLAGFAVSITTAYFVYLLTNATSTSSSSALWPGLAGGIGGLALAGALLVVQLNQRNTVSSLRVAILGMPQVGKTTLITACFQEIFSRRVNIRAVMSGKRSFEALNDNIARLAAGNPIKPTKDQDVAAYRFEIEPSGWLTSRYRVEFGDFPGENTAKYVEEYGPWLHNTPFFEWALTCDAFVFCVDVGPLAGSFKYEQNISNIFDRDRGLSERRIASEYVNESSAQIRAAWQHIVADFGQRRSAHLRSSPLLLVFTKLDLLFRSSEVENAPSVMVIEEARASGARTWLTHQFMELVSYLGGESSNFSTAATSSFAMSKQDRLGISEFLHDILPRKAFSSGAALQRSSSQAPHP